MERWTAFIAGGGVLDNQGRYDEVVSMLVNGEIFGGEMCV